MTTRRRPATEFQLAMFVGSGAEIVTLGDFLARGARARTGLDVSPSASAVSLRLDGEEQWGPRLSFGALGMVVEQLLPARDRLVEGERALIRAGGFDGPVSEFILFEPRPSGALRASLIASDHDDAWSWTPHGPHGDLLYALVDRDGEAMARLGRRLRDIGPLTVAADAVVDDLEREAERGARVVELLGPGDV